MNVCYIRVSTEKQAEFGHSLENQKNRLLDYCEQHNISDPIIYKDDGYSGGTINRPKYKQLLKDIENNKVNNLIFLKMDRISRSVIDFTNLISLCEKHKTNVISLQENLNGKTAIDKFSRGIFINMAEMERNQISERTKAGYVGALEKGLYPFGGKTSLGIGKDKETKTLYYDEDKKIVIDIFDLDKEGYSNIQITKLIEEKYSLKFHHNKIEEILKNTLYMGYKIYGGEKYQLIEKPLIEKNKYLKLEKKDLKVDLIKVNKRINNKHFYELCQKIVYIPLNNYLYSTTAKKFLKSTQTYKYYKYYFSTDKKVKLNEEQLLKIIDKEVVSSYAEKEKKRQTQLKNLQTLFTLGDISVDEYNEMKNRIMLRNSTNIKVSDVEIKVDSNYDLYLNEKVVNYKVEMRKIK